MSAAVKLALPPRHSQSRAVGRCPYCGGVLIVPRRYNAVDFCPRAKRASASFSPHARRFTLKDGHRMTRADPNAQRPAPRPSLFARLWARLTGKAAR